MAELREALQKTSSLRYVGVWITLVVLTTATFLLSKAPLHTWHLPVALFIATAKASLIFFFFMHLILTKGASRMTILVALVLVGLLMSLVVADFHTRFQPTIAPGPHSPQILPEGRGPQIQ